MDLMLGFASNLIAEFIGIGFVFWLDRRLEKRERLDGRPNRSIWSTVLAWPFTAAIVFSTPGVLVFSLYVVTVGPRFGPAMEYEYLRYLSAFLFTDALAIFILARVLGRRRTAIVALLVGTVVHLTAYSVLAFHRNPISTLQDLLAISVSLVLFWRCRQASRRDERELSQPTEVTESTDVTLSPQVHPEHHVSGAALLLDFARELLREGKDTEGLAAFEKLLSDAEFAAEGQYGIGCIKLKAGETDAAAMALGKCLELDPGHANAAYLLGMIAESDQQPDLALAYFRHALGADPLHAGALEKLRAADAHALDPPDPAQSDEQDQEARLAGAMASVNRTRFPWTPSGLR